MKRLRYRKLSQISSENSDFCFFHGTSVLSVSRKIITASLTYYENWGFINVTLSESVVNAIYSDLKGDINKIEILDRDGKSVYSESINLDFKQDFFKDVQPLCDNYNTYINEVNSDDKAVKEAAEEKFNKFYEGTESSKGFEETFLENTNYTFRLAKTPTVLQ